MRAVELRAIVYRQCAVRSPLQRSRSGAGTVWGREKASSTGRPRGAEATPRARGAFLRPSPAWTPGPLAVPSPANCLRPCGVRKQGGEGPQGGPHPALAAKRGEHSVTRPPRSAECGPRLHLAGVRRRRAAELRAIRRWLGAKRDRGGGKAVIYCLALGVAQCCPHRSSGDLADAAVELCAIRHRPCTERRPPRCGGSGDVTM